MLTGIRDVDVLILLAMTDQDLKSYCQSDPKNAYSRKLCFSDELWLNKTIQKYGEEALQGKSSNMTWRDYYTQGYAAKYADCLSLKRAKHVSQIVASDMYDPQNGIINGRLTRDIEGMTYLLLKLTLNKMIQLNMGGQDKLKQVIREASTNIPDYRQEFSKDTVHLTQSEIEHFKKLIKVKLSVRDVARFMYRSRPDLKDVSPQLILEIHNKFIRGELELTALWTELCDLL